MPSGYMFKKEIKAKAKPNPIEGSQGYDSRALLPTLPKQKITPFPALPRVKAKGQGGKKAKLDGENNPVRAETSELPKRNTVKQLPTKRYPRRAGTGGPTVPRPKSPVLV